MRLTKQISLLSYNDISRLYQDNQTVQMFAWSEFNIFGASFTSNTDHILIIYYHMAKTYFPFLAPCESGVGLVSW